jgi:hypothetical protein
MFCPGCGIEDRSANQFCRSCGADLRSVRTAIASPDQITASAVSARDEIGRAIAAKIHDLQGEDEWSTFAEEVLPEIEKFIESPAERRLRRMRAGMILSAIGVGTAFGISIVSRLMDDQNVIFLAALGVVAFFLGIGLILNGMFLTVPRREVAGRGSDADRQRSLDAAGNTNDLELPAASTQFASVTEHTTKHLKDPIKK